MDNHTHTQRDRERMNILGLDIPLFAKLYSFYKNFSDVLHLFPKGKRYTLGQKTDQLILDTLELIITASYSERSQKLPLLQKASIKVDLLKILLRLSCDTKCITNQKYQELSNQLIEIGKMVGGWMKMARE